jgi:hypothetical protein
MTWNKQRKMEREAHLGPKYQEIKALHRMGIDNLAIAGKYRDPCFKGFILVPNSRLGLL